MRRTLLVTTAVIAVACTEADPPPTSETPKTEPTVPPYTGAHVLDGAVHERFYREGITFEEASRNELCRRLMADMLGRLPSLDEIESECGTRTVEEIVTDFQSRARYRYTAQRVWRDRLQIGFSIVDWRDVKALFDDLDRMVVGGLPYDQFARNVLLNTAFIVDESDNAEDRVRKAFEVFLGRPASDAEAADLAGLVRPWFLGDEPDPDFPYTYRVVGIIEPFLCEVLSCSATLYGGGTLDIRPRPDFEPIRITDLTPAERESLGTFGRIVTSRPFFYEAAADEMLDRILGWSDGGRMPRRPGTVLPELRDALARHLETTNDYASAERLVYTSQLYRMKAGAQDGPVYASGPVKAAAAEVWLESTLRLTELDDAEICDPRYLGEFGLFAIFEAFEEGEITEAQLYEDIQRLQDLQGVRGPRDDEGFVSYEFTELAMTIGGCPLFPADRRPPDGLSFGYAQDALANYLCSPELLPPSGETTVGPLVERYMRALYGRAPTAEEIQIFETELAACAPGTCNADSIPNRICTAIAGSAEALFY